MSVRWAYPGALIPLAAAGASGESRDIGEICTAPTLVAPVDVSARGDELRWRMQSLGLFARVVLLIVLALVAGCVSLQCLTGQVQLRGLLAEKRKGAVDPGRVQLLIGALGLAFALVGRLPEMQLTRHLTLSSTAWPVVAGMSHALYLVRKFRQWKA